MSRVSEPTVPEQTVLVLEPLPRRPTPGRRLRAEPLAKAHR